jgi:N-acetylneuraminate synthase
MKAVEIGKRVIGTDHPPFVVAEMSGNHDGSLETALKIVDAAAEAGADAIKLQTYTADTMTLDCDAPDFLVKPNNPLWKGERLYSLYAKAHTPWEWHKPIFDRARARGILAFSSAFDATSVDFLESLDVPAYKIASFENNHVPLLRKIASTGKPVVMSTGMTTLSDLDESVSVLQDAGCRDLVLLKCTSMYPASPRESNLSAIPHLAKAFDCVVGLSDHTPGIAVPVAAVALGARFIEKHLCLDRAGGGVDAAFSLDPPEFKALVDACRMSFEAIGRERIEIAPGEKPNREYKRSIYIAEDVAAGDVLTAENVRIVRPGKGLAPKYYDIVLGRRVSRSVKKGTPLSWDLIA